MGRIYFAKCEHCDYEYETYIGVILSIDREQHLLRKIQRGEYGEEIKKKAETIPNCYISTSYELFVCQKCGNIERNELIKLCDGKDISEIQHIHDKYPCTKCKGKMKYIKIEDDFVCPICKNKIKFNPCGWWN